MGRIAIYYLIILIGIFSCSNQKQYSKIQDIVDEVEIEYAPDNRTVIFNINVQKTKPIVLAGETNSEEAKSKLLGLIQSAELSIVNEIVILPDESVGDKKFAIINVSVANLRFEPKHSAELVSQAILGTPVKVLKKKDGWYLVQTPDKYIAWINNSSFTLMNQNQFYQWKNQPKIIYLNSFGFSLNEAKTHISY